MYSDFIQEPEDGKYRHLRRVVILCGVLFMLDVLLLLVMIPITFYTVSLLLAQLIVVVFLSAVAMGLLKGRDRKE